MSTATAAVTAAAVEPHRHARRSQSQSQPATSSYAHRTRGTTHAAAASGTSPSSQRTGASTADHNTTTTTTTRPRSTSRSRRHPSSSSPTSRSTVDSSRAQRDYEQYIAAGSVRRSSPNRPPTTARAESLPSASGPTSTQRYHHRNPSSRSHPQHAHRPTAEMATAAVASGAGPAPVAVPAATPAVDHRHAPAARHGKSRTTIPAQSGNWILGKTIGQGSMGKVKLARRAEGGEQVAVKIVPRGSTEDSHHQSRADRERADHSKEIRTAREAAIVTLLDHPYICGMRDVVRTNYHWYMLFEYIDGCQMLDYIISHTKLKEKSARKFSRQIASALDYCHRNSIVHRDLKIENILISNNGDIKIIDFGLSNLFAPRRHLKTFCGSLYFAAPELLQARQYTGPEVDVWSFGVVLYVLVCGKVPFDDQSMPALHAKIKKGQVDYPNWLSPDCKHLISRMLVTDPKQRASLQEVMNHPWMIKGVGGPPENYLPAREPLKSLDPEVIQAMTGFDFGSTDHILTQLTQIIESPDYQRAVKLAQLDRETQASKDLEKKSRGFGFDFYKRRNSVSSRDTLTIPSSEALQLGNDPINAYDPLISVYYLVKEKQERDRAAAHVPTTPGKTHEETIKAPDLPEPQAAHTNAAAYEMPGEKATGGRARPRARTHGEDEVTEAMKHTRIGAHAPGSPAIVEPEQPARKESTAAGILRRFSTRRRKEPEREKPPPMVTIQSANEPASPRKSFSVRRTRADRPSDGPPSSAMRSGSSQPHNSQLLSPPRTADAPQRSSKGLGRSTSVNSAEYRRRFDRHADEIPPIATFRDPPAKSGPDQSRMQAEPQDDPEAPPDAVEPKVLVQPKSATMRAKSLGHARRESIQARRARREEARTAHVPEESDQDVGNTSGLSADRVDRTEQVKPVFLKGLFSVSTTSTKSISAIRADIIRVLKELGIDYTEDRGGFYCKKQPSIDLNKVVDHTPNSPSAIPSPSHRRRISFGTFMGGGDRERDEFRDTERPPQTPRTPRRHGDTSFTNSDASDESVGHGRRTGETSTHVHSDLGGSMVLEFEIVIVKVPLLSLHGIQFKRIAGGAWQYKNMADHILKELRL